MIRAAAFAAILLLAGCASPEAGIKTQPVDIAVAVHCKHKPIPEPSWKDADGVDHPGFPDTPENLSAAPDHFVRVQYLLDGRSMRIQREKELAAALTGCE